METVYLNEYYYGNSEFHADDIAIVVLRNRISFSIGVSPICVDWTGRNTIPNGAEGKVCLSYYLNNKIVIIIFTVNFCILSTYHN